MIWRSILKAARSPGVRDADRLDQIPLAAPRVGKNGDGSVRLATGSLEEADATSGERREISVEVARLEEISHSPPGLVADSRKLPLVARNREHDARALAGFRGNRDPALAWLNRSVLDHREAKRVDKEGQSLIIARDQNAEGGDAPDHGARRYRI